MFKTILFVLLNFTFISAQAAEISVKPLFDEETFRTHLTIPFKVVGGTLAVDALENVVPIDSPNCKTLIDFNNKNNFLVKCTQEGSVSLKVHFRSGNSNRSFTYGPFTVKKISESGTVTDGGSTAPDEVWTLGQTLFYKSEGKAQSCAECHAPGDNKSGLTATTLKAALSGSNTMKTKSIWSVRTLTDAELAALVKYIKSH